MFKLTTFFQKIFVFSNKKNAHAFGVSIWFTVRKIVTDYFSSARYLMVRTICEV